MITLLCSISTSIMAAENMQQQNTAEREEQVFFIVRHAEKLEGKNPNLSPQGQLRAIKLARILSSIELDSIYSTNYNRTRETAEPIAQRQHVDISLYDPSNMALFSQALLLKSGNVLVVGHSNTTTNLIKLLGAKKQIPIDDANEFDRLYIVTISYSSQQPHVSTVMLRY